MAISPIIIAGGIAAAGAVAGGAISANASQNAAQTEANAAMSSNQLQDAEFQQQQQNLAPWISAGTQALNTLQKGIQPGGQFNKPFTMQDFQLDPGTQFQTNAGNAAITASAAAGGKRFSPATAEALAQYNQQVAGSSYQNSYNRYMQQEQLGLNETQSMAQVGQTATNSLNQLGGTYATNAGANIIGAGNAIAAGQVGSANAINGALSGGGSNLLNSYLMNNLLNSSTNQFSAQDVSMLGQYQNDYNASGGLMQVGGGYTVNLPAPVGTSGGTSP